VALVERAIRNWSKSRDVVLDPFGGAGSTLIACEKTGRHARLIELDPKYVDTTICGGRSSAAAPRFSTATAGATERSPVCGKQPDASRDVSQLLVTTSSTATYWHAAAASTNPCQIALL
jgi:hypothetical protein